MTKILLKNLIYQKRNHTEAPSEANLSVQAHCEPLYGSLNRKENPFYPQKVILYRKREGKATMRFSKITVAQTEMESECIWNLPFIEWKIFIQPQRLLLSAGSETE